MPESEDRVARLHLRLTTVPDHEKFRGVPPDITGLTPLELGQLWNTLQRALGTDAHRESAYAILQQTRQMGLVPALDPPACLEVFRDITSVLVAVETLAYLASEPPAGLAQELRRILDSSHWKEGKHPLTGLYHYSCAALARFIDATAFEEVQQYFRQIHADSPYVLKEFECAGQLSSAALLALANPKVMTYYWPNSPYGEDPAIALVGEAAYIEFAREALTQAHQHLSDIHDGKIPYVADGAFATRDAHVLARAARVASLRDEPWFRDLIEPLLAKVCVAPTSAKTLPSQSLAIALGHTIQGVPTAESVQALRAALGALRHAGVKKKLARNLKPAERGLSERPEMALRVTRQMKPDKRQLGLLATCLEAGFWQELDLSYAHWQANLLQTPAGAAFARLLIWNFREPSGGCVTAMSSGGNEASPCMMDSDERPIEINPNSRVSLWHPLHADEGQRDTWRALIQKHQIKQPIRQAYREYYLPRSEELSTTSTEMFSGHILSLVPLIGLARREGWQINKEGALIRAFADVRAVFRIWADLYPGVQGYGDSGPIHFEKRQRKRWTQICIADIPPIIFSEMCRAVDLLVSVAGFAIEDGTSSMPHTLGDIGVRMAGQVVIPAPATPHPRVARMVRLAHLARLNLNDMASTRRAVLARIFARHIAAGTIVLEERHLRLGPHAIHLQTARVTKDGAPVELTFPGKRAKLHALPWLPYDEALLQKIVDSVGVLLVPTTS